MLFILDTRNVYEFNNVKGSFFFKLPLKSINQLQPWREMFSSFFVIYTRNSQNQDSILNSLKKKKGRQKKKKKSFWNLSQGDSMDQNQESK